MRKLSSFAIAGVIASLSMGCSSEDVPQAHKGRMFERTGWMTLYSGGKGFEGPMLGPGTHFTGVYNTVKIVDCSQDTAAEQLSALTKDNIQFKLTANITFSANCSDEKALLTILDSIASAPAGGDVDGRTVTKAQLYTKFIRPAIGEAVRRAVSPYMANDINAQREQIFSQVIENFATSVGELKPQWVTIAGVKLNNLDFPEALDKANERRAQVTIEKEIAIAEREKVEEQITTAEKKKKLAEAEGKTAAAKIDEIGASWKRNPAYLQLRMMEAAGSKGNMIIMGSGATQPNLMLNVNKNK